MRLLKPFVLVRICSLFSERIGHFVADSVHHYIRNKELPTASENPTAKKVTKIVDERKRRTEKANGKDERKRPTEKTNGKEEQKRTPPEAPNKLSL